MANYELYRETINPCGGSEYSQKEFLEVETDDPEAFVRAEGRFPIISAARNADGDMEIITGNSVGYMVRYIFTE